MLNDFANLELSIKFDPYPTDLPEPPSIETTKGLDTTLRFTTSALHIDGKIAILTFSVSM